MNRGRLIVLRTSLEKLVNKRGLLNPRQDERFNAQTQDLKEILDFLVDLEEDKAFWSSDASR